MDTQGWTIAFAAINAVIAVTAVLAALAAPRISARLTSQTELARTKRQEKLLVFAQLMSNRPASESLDAVRALNLIDVLYHDHKEVRRLWRQLFDMLTNANFFEPGSGVGWELIKQKRAELLTAMARDLNYEIDTFDVDRVYAPRWLVEHERIVLAERKMKLAAAENFFAAVPGAAAPAEQTVPAPNGVAASDYTSTEIPEKSIGRDRRKTTLATTTQKGT